MYNLYRRKNVHSYLNKTSILKNYEFSTRVGTIVDRLKVQKQAGVVHTMLNYSRTIKIVRSLPCLILYHEINAQ